MKKLGEWYVVQNALGRAPNDMDRRDSICRGGNYHGHHRKVKGAGCILGFEVSTR